MDLKLLPDALHRRILSMVLEDPAPLGGTSATPAAETTQSRSASSTAQRGRNQVPDSHGDIGYNIVELSTGGASIQPSQVQADMACAPVPVIPHLARSGMAVVDEFITGQNLQVRTRGSSAWSPPVCVGLRLPVFCMAHGAMPCMHGVWTAVWPA